MSQVPPDFANTSLRRRAPLRATSYLLIGLTPGLIACGARNELTPIEKQAEIARMYAEFERDFPAVESVEATDLLARLEARPGGSTTRSARITVVDVRPEKERRVSMIAGAITLEEFEENPEHHADATLVTYCTIGYRSGLVARELQNRGYEVLNLRGSLLSWTHAGGDLVDADGPTTRLHVYGERWNLAPEAYETTW